MQWMKRFWDTNFPGHAYDPVARRRGQPTDTPATLAPISGARTTNTPGLGGRSGGKTPISGHRAGSAGAANHEQVLGLQAQLKEMSTHLEGLEKERDFYFAKVSSVFFYSYGRRVCVLTHGCHPLVAARYRDPSAAADRRSPKGGS
jgi:RP/EB family microtubule-associated protein